MNIKRSNLLKVILFICTGSIFLSACTAGGGSTTARREAADGAATAAPEEGAVNANLQGASNANASVVPHPAVQNLDSNAFNAATSNLKQVNAVPKGPAPFGALPAPDDSVFTSGSRGERFFETRTFNSHPVLAKIEKIIDGKNTTYKVYLRGGKVIDASAEKMANFRVVAPENILEAIGLQATAQSNSAVKKEDGKIEKQP